MAYTGFDGITKAYRAEGGAIAKGISVIPGTAANQVKLPTGANQMPVGITCEAIAEGEYGNVLVFGFAQAKTDGGTDFAVGDPLSVETTNGYLVKTAITNGLHICARAHEASTEDEHVISVFFCPFGYLPTA
jgi:hypothetical protein